mmetsp:Transcript_6088/g.18206  ORF Transcript_6088/g.18206 Transcript_6088/m.18206 type:complete len:528 (-) Transcript_6088:25-1608(-)
MVPRLLGNKGGARLEEAERLQNALQLKVVLIIHEKPETFSHPVPVALGIQVVVPPSLLPPDLRLGERGLHQIDQQAFGGLLLVQTPHAFINIHDVVLLRILLLLCPVPPVRLAQAQLVFDPHKQVVRTDADVDVFGLNPEWQFHFQDHIVLVLRDGVRGLQAPCPVGVAPEEPFPRLARIRLGQSCREYPVIFAPPHLYREFAGDRPVEDPVYHWRGLFWLKLHLASVALEGDLLVLVSRGHVDREINVRTGLGPHVVLCDSEIVCQPRLVPKILDELVSHVLEVSDFLELEVVPEVGVLKLKPPGVLQPLLLHLFPAELLQHVARLVHQRPVESELALPVALQGAELTDVHLASPALGRCGAPANFTDHDELGVRVHLKAVEGHLLLELVQHEILATVEPPGDPLDVPKFHMLLPRVINLPPLLVPEDVVRPLDLSKLLRAAPPLIRVMQPRLLPERSFDLLGTRLPLNPKHVIVKRSLQVLHALPSSSLGPHNPNTNHSLARHERSKDNRTISTPNCTDKAITDP